MSPTKHGVMRFLELAAGTVAIGVGVVLLLLTLVGWNHRMSNPTPTNGPIADLVAVGLLGLFCSWIGIMILRDRRATDEVGARSRTRSPVWALFLSLLVPGLGHLYASRIGPAIVFFGLHLAFVFAAGFGALGRTFPSLVVLVIAGFVLFFTAAVSAVFAVSRSAMPRRRWFETVLGSLAVLLVVTASVTLLFGSMRSLKSFAIPSGAMEPTVLVGERIMVDLDHFANHDLARGDVVIFTSPQDPTTTLMKRAVAIGGDVVSIESKQLLINGDPVEEPWAVFRDPRVAQSGSPPALARRDHMASVRIPDGHFFALGDNRDQSYDSRFYGVIPIDALEGAVIYVYWSPVRARIGTRIESAHLE